MNKIVVQTAQQTSLNHNLHQFSHNAFVGNSVIQFTDSLSTRIAEINAFSAAGICR